MSMVYDPNVPKREPKPTPKLPDSVMEMFSMKGKVSIIVGAAAGIGRAATESLAEAGSDVALFYNSNDTAVKVASDLAQKHSVKAKAYKVQVTDFDAVRAAVQKVNEDFGHVDVMIANAGVGKPGGIIDMTLEDWKRIVDVNYYGVVHCAKAAGEIFRKQGKGNLIITSSMSAHIVNVPIDQPCYNSTKAAVTHLGKSLAREWREFARCNIVSPGFFSTDLGAAPEVESEANRMAVLGRQGDTKELKGIFLYLASDASTYTTGSDFIVDGGYTLP